VSEIKQTRESLQFFFFSLPISFSFEQRIELSNLMAGTHSATGTNSYTPDNIKLTKIHITNEKKMYIIVYDYHFKISIFFQYKFFV